ncbi:PA2928 family protein [Microbacterium sp. LWH10-1.2]|uniref:PA2928 family protein n=1 Tax=Microbacterium sp. LWH10-1.2 TaxID=3135255 RepID=UPI00313A3001
MNTNESRGYVLNGSTVVPLGSSAVPPPRSHDPKRVRRRLRLRFLGFLLAPVLIGGLIFIATALFSPSSRDVEILPGAAAISIDEQDVALVVYADDSRPGIGEPMFQTRAAAIRLSDGATLWDQRLNEELGSEAAALAGDSSLVYVATDEGLVILDATTGAIRAEGHGIDGIGADAVFSASAYGYDVETNAVVALTGTGAVVQIPVGALAASPAEASVARRWQGTLSASAFLDTAALTRLVDTATATDGTTVGIETVAEAVSRDALVITSPDGALIRRTELVDAEIIPLTGAQTRLGVMLPTGQFLEGDFSDIDQDDIEALLEAASAQASAGGALSSPAGFASGYVLVQHRESVNAERMLLSSVSVATGELVDTVEMGADAMRAIAGPSGTTAVIAADPDAWQPDTLRVLDADGSLRRIEVGSVPWWVISFG